MMKVMSRDFTLKEKVLLIIMAVILLGAVYYLVVDQPVRNAIANAKNEQENLNMELMLQQQKAMSLANMQNELDVIENIDVYGEMGSYNNSKAELDELNQLLKAAQSYNISFSNVSREGDLIRRTFSLTFTAADYEKAEDLITKLCENKWRCLISNISFVSSEKNLQQGSVNVGLTATFYETMTGGTPDSGLPQDTAEISDSSVE